jgi:hypothetical protein
VRHAAALAVPLPAVLATSGPGSSVSAIPELSMRIGAEWAEGVALRFKFTGGGGIAIREILAGNAQFGVFGLNAAMSQNLAELRLVGLAALVERDPLLAERMVRVVQRTLAWRRAHSPEETVAALGLTGGEAAAFGAMLRQYPQQFSADGHQADGQIGHGARAGSGGRTTAHGRAP